MRRRHIPGSFRSWELTRLITMVVMLGVIWMLIQRAGDPDTWRWLTNDDSRVEPPIPPANPANAEVVVPGPTDRDEEEREAAAEQYQAVADRSPLAAEEMPAYWRLLRWSRAQSFDELVQRSRRDLLYTHFFEDPEEQRGELVLLRLHIKRSLTFVAPENSAGVERVYEAWGWTNESKSPYLVVFSELPRGMPLGPDIHEDVTFAGYFLKTMSYEAFDVTRSAPLLLGRLRWTESPIQAARRTRGTDYFWPTAIVGGLVLAWIGWTWIRPSRGLRERLAEVHVSAEEDAVERWLAGVDEQLPEERG